MHAVRYRLSALVAASVLIGSCVGNDSPTGVRGSVDIAIPLQPALIPSPADAGAAPITRIRAWASRTADSVTVGQYEGTVDPAAEEWTIDLVVSAPPDPGVQVEYFVLLMSGSEGSEVVEFSGRSDPVTVSSGQTVEGQDLPILRGPLANHFVTGVTIASAPDSLGEGAGAVATADVSTSGSEVPAVYWTALDSAVLSVTDSTVTGVAPGVGRIVASAGRFADTTTVTVVPVPATVVVTPDSVTVDAVGLQATFQAVVLDARGDTLPEPVVWSSGSPAILSSLGDGTFEGLAIGTGTVLASAASDPTVMGSATMTVAEGSIPGIDVAVEKIVDEPQPLADSTVIFTVRVINNGPDAATDVVVFDTLPTAPFTGVQTGVTNGTLDGDTLWTIPALAAGDTAIWTTTATVISDAAGSSASNIALLRSLAENDTTPANDTARVDMNFPISAIPVVTITSPTDGTVFDPGDLVTFNATASDAEDGDLTAAIQWTSSVDGLIGTGASFETSQLTTGVHTVSAAATDSDDGVGADTVQITIALITTPTTLNVPFGGTASLPITLSEPAQAGGVTLDVVSSAPGITTPDAATIFIAEGTLSSNSTLTGILPGQANLTVSHPQFGASVTVVSVTAELNIVQNSVSVPDGFPQTMDVRLESEGSPTAAPSGGIAVTLETRDATCLTAAGSTQIQAGLVSEPVTLTAAAGAQTPCSSWIVASAPSLNADSVLVNVTATPTLTFSNFHDLGAGLQDGTYAVSLGTNLHGGTTVRIQSDDPSQVLISPAVGVPGSAFIDRIVTPGVGSTGFYLQALEGAADSVGVTATAPGFTDGTSAVNVVQPRMGIYGLDQTRTALSPHDIFDIRTGTASTGTTPLTRFQAVRAGGDSIFATLTTSAPTVGQVITLTDSVAPVTVGIAPGNWASTSSFAAGAVALDAGVAGTATITASIPGFNTTSVSSLDVAVVTPGITTYNVTVGSGLQRSAPYAYLEANAHGGVSVTITSRDPTTVLVSPDLNTAGSASIVVPVADGAHPANFYVQALEGQTGTVVVDVTAPGFDPDSAIVTVVQPALDIVSLTQTTTTLTADDVFYMRTGVANGQQTALSELQAIRAGGTAVDITVTSSNTGAGLLVTSTDTASTFLQTVQPIASNTPTTLATGGVAFAPVGAGVTTVTASATGFITTSNAARAVTVSQPTLNVNSYRVGSGLQYGNLNGTLSATDHGGVTVRLESTDPQTLLVSPNDSTPGTAFIDVPVPDGGNLVRYYIQGVEGATGTADIRITAPGFAADSATNTVEPPHVQVVGLLNSQNTFGADDAFQLRIGVPFSGGSSLQILQAIRAGGAPVDFTVNNSNSGVGQLETSATTGSTIVMTIPVGEFWTPSSVAAGGIAFDPLGIGTTVVTATAPGFTPTADGTQTVTVSAPGMTIADRRVGAGLQYANLTAILGAGNHGGVTVRVTSSNPGVLLVAPDATTAGTGFIDVVVAPGATVVPFVIQGVEGQDASATLTFSAPGFTNGVATMTVEPPAIELISLGNSYSTDASDDVFQVRTGVAFSNNARIQIPQPIRTGGTAVTATITSSDGTAATLVTQSGSGATATVTLGESEVVSPATVAGGGVAIDPLSVGATTISVTMPGFVPTTDATRVVTITP